MVYSSEQKELFNPKLLEDIELFQAITRMGNDGILVLGEENRIEFVNEMASFITGYQTKDLLGRKFIELLSERNQKFFQSIQAESNK